MFRFDLIDLILFIYFSDTEVEASFRLKENVSTDGLCYATRSLPFPMKRLVENKLQRLQKLDVIYPVVNRTIASPIVPVVKQKGPKNPIRISCDYSLTLNKIINRDHYCVPRLEDILEVSPCKLFSVRDFSGAHLQIPLPRRVSYLSAVLHAYNSLQFGISTAPLIFSGSD